MPQPQTPLDAALKGKTKELLQAIEDSLPSSCGAIVLLYNREGTELDLTVAAIHEKPGEAIKILQAAPMAILDRLPKSPEIEYTLPEGASPSSRLVSSLRVRRLGEHDHVRVWSRGGLAGEFVMTAGDGAHLAEHHGLVRR